LKRLDYVDAGNVFIFGDRIGGVAAPRVAAEASPKGVIAWATIGRPFIEAQLDASRQHQQQEDFDEAQIKETLAAMKEILEQVLIDGKSPTEVSEAKPDRAALVAQIAQDGATVLGRNLNFMRQLAKLDIAAAWKRVPCDVLVLWGAGDWTSCQADGQAIADAVNSQHKGRAKFVELPGIDGTFSKVQDMEESFLASTPGDFNPVIVEEIVRWIAAQKDKPGAE
jgi:hypothetical protein